MIKLITATVFALLISFAVAQPTIDGAIADGEYANTVTHDDSGMVVYWTIDDDMIYMGFTLEARGWVGIGWGDEMTNRKAGFDVIIVTEMDGEFVALDMFQESARGEPVLDSEEGGSNSIVDFAASHEGDLWTVEFSRPLDTGEDTDVAITPGPPMIFMGAYANVMDPSRAHGRSTQGGAWYIEDFTF